MSDLTLRPLDDADRPWLRRLVHERWGGAAMITRGRVVYPAEHEGFVARRAGRPVGVVTFECRDGQCEVTLLDSLEAGSGIGTALIEQAIAAARERGCGRLWLITTNDNLGALAFYQKRGLRLVAVYPGAVDESRALKPTIPDVADNGIPIHDEIELAVRLQ